MPRKLTRDEWIARAVQIHGTKYDYRHVVYKTKDLKVLIVCEKHGGFEQIANNHIRGKGCPKCAKNSRLDTKSFIEKANVVHSGKYTYDKTHFVNTASKIDIECKLHGMFKQEANSHLQGSGCPECANISRSVAVSTHPDRANNIKNTVLSRYGVKNVMMVDDIKQRQIDTVLKQYGVDNYTKTDEYKERYREIMMDKYGVDHYSRSVDFKSKIISTSQSRYGVDNYTQSEKYASRVPDILVKSRATQLKKYGAEHYAKSDDFYKRLPDMLQKGYLTKVKNKSFRYSKPEMTMYSLLVTVFGDLDVLRQYKDDRYPYACDFYIKSLDLFIELNATWTHGGGFFNEDDVEHQDRLIGWHAKALTSDYYKNAIDTWTRRDVAKRKSACDNNLNYLVFWDADLTDFKRWLTDNEYVNLNSLQN